MEKWLLLILIINFIMAIIYLFWGIFRFKNKKKERGHRAKYLMLSFVIIICPLIGVLFLIFSHFLYILFSKRNVDMSDVSFSREKIKVCVEADVEREINMAPMNEVLLVSDTKRRRKMLLDVLKKDVRKSLGSIAMALENPDSETSHYAASVLMDALSEFKGTVQNMLAKQKKVPEDYELGSLLFEYISKVLAQNIFSEEEEKSYVYTLEEIAENMFRYNPDRVEGWQYRRMIDSLVKICEYPIAEKWAKRAMKHRDYQLDIYIACLKLYFSYGNKDAFFECIDHLKKTGIVVNKETMDLIRIFEN